MARRRAVLTIQNRGMPAPRFSLEQHILRYYESGQEAERLESPFSRWEKVRTLDLLDRFLPRAPALILDVGGAAGAYAFPLTERGYVVDLVDPVPLHVEQAKQRAAMYQLDYAQEMSVAGPPESEPHLGTPKILR